MSKIRLKSIKKIKSEDSYEIEIKDNNNYFVNGFLKHNCRCIIICDKNGIVKAYSRSGKEFQTLDVLKHQFESAKIKNTMFDGEVCLVDKKGVEDFQGIQSEYNRKDHTIINPKYYVFDCMSYADFFNGESKYILSKRLKVGKKILTRIKSTYIELLEQDEIFSFESVDKLLKDAEFWEWEGLILRKDIPYESGRSSNILKVKQMHEAEYKVIAIESTSKRMIIKGKEKEVTCMGVAIINYKKNSVGVGSGWSDEERIYYYKNPKKILNKIITVQYKKESKDKNGKLSLQFPVVKAIHGVRREV